MTNNSIENKSCFNAANVDRSIYEIYHLLPACNFCLDDGGITETAKKDLLTALKKHIGNANDILLHGLQSLGDIIANAACLEEFSLSNYQLQSLGNLISLNINLLESNLCLIEKANAE